MSICSLEEREAGRSYPRTCPTCGLNGCTKFGKTPLNDSLHKDKKILDLETELHETLNMLFECASDLHLFDREDLNERGKEIVNMLNDKGYWILNINNEG